MNMIIRIFIQATLTFFTIYLLTRVLGKKQISQLTFYDYVNGVTFGSIAATAATNVKNPTWYYLWALFVFALFTFLVQYITLKNRKVRKVLEGEPTILIHKGKILEDNMEKSRFNMADLMAELRQRKIFDIKNVHFALLETNGKVSVMPVAKQNPVTPADLNIQPKEQTIATELIVDGKIIKSNLEQHNLTEKWLKQKVSAENVEVEDIVWLSYNPIDKSLYFDFKADKLGKDKVDISDN
ncbi:putative membrane protein [Halobacteroides halobius DSM 5150]|uniref:Putative membrane protein n=1 Tax=Halobacteroides halobius (strain ATCC 35273 / DSM 5150 / MD-1) TaxID=748449 RepID=L0K8P1_HALHC|nr:DUF421 domain-containing protein [Halobacteroides halobius]AGB40905.1 putative membrane protein [Halobacteroides halobius DSM 5150]